MAVEHQPPDELMLLERDPLYFLAGPIQGAPDWQAQAVEIIDALAPARAAHIANPRRAYVDGTFVYEDQVTWEDRGRARAAKCGAVLFWLAAKDESLPYEAGRSYGQTTRFEFGEAMGWLAYDPYVRLSIGIEPGYIGSERYYRHQAARFSLPVHATLEDTCRYALRAKKEEDHGNI